jgi:hypothetical protein
MRIWFFREMGVDMEQIGSGEATVRATLAPTRLQSLTSEISFAVKALSSFAVQPNVDPTISVIMPAYNRRTMIDRSLLRDRTATIRSAIFLHDEIGLRCCSEGF